MKIAYSELLCPVSIRMKISFSYYDASQYWILLLWTLRLAIWLDIWSRQWVIRRMIKSYLYFIQLNDFYDSSLVLIILTMIWTNRWEWNNAMGREIKSCGIYVLLENIWKREANASKQFEDNKQVQAAKLFYIVIQNFDSEQIYLN